MTAVLIATCAAILAVGVCGWFCARHDERRHGFDTAADEAVALTKESA